MPNRPKIFTPYRESRNIKAFKSRSESRGANERGYTYRWQKVREQFLKRNPICKHCIVEDKVAPSTEVDHMIPHKGDMRLFWMADNWQGLCKYHHSRKTFREKNMGDRYVVSGKPGAGKTTYVESRRRTGDAVFDWDHIANTIFGRTLHTDDYGPMMAIRKTFIESVLSYAVRGNIYVIVSNESSAKDIARQMEAEHIHLTARGE